MGVAATVGDGLLLDCFGAAAIGRKSLDLLLGAGCPSWA
jgi:hypothetical protein